MSIKLMERLLDPDDKLIEDILDEINTTKYLKRYDTSGIKPETNWLEVLELGNSNEKRPSLLTTRWL